MPDTVIKVENLSKSYRLKELYKQTNSFAPCSRPYALCSMLLSRLGLMSGNVIGKVNNLKPEEYIAEVMPDGGQVSRK